MVPTNGVLNSNPVITSSSVAGVNNQILNNTNSVFQNNVVLATEKASNKPTKMKPKKGS